jgi:hypothetical protein
MAKDSFIPSRKETLLIGRKISYSPEMSEFRQSKLLGERITKNWIPIFFPLDGTKNAE